MSDILIFKSKQKKEIKENKKDLFLRAKDVEMIGFINYDDRSLFIKNRDDIAKIIAFISQNKITIMEIK